jgi:predicted RNA binding protein YcfA (HicA-like mRNA interferase family)
MKGRQLIKKLQALGVEIETGRGKGGHVQTGFNGRKTVIKTHGGKDLSKNYVNLVCKQLGINQEDL